MKRSIVLLLTAAVLLLGAPAVAPAAPPAGSARSAEAKDRYKRTTRMTFKDDVVNGRRAAGGGSVVNVHGRSTHSSLIVVRQTFLPELVKSADLF